MSTDNIAFIENHVGLALGRLAMQYQEKPRLAALVQAFAGRMQDLEDVFRALHTRRTFDFFVALDQQSPNPLLESTSQQLDEIGELIGERRKTGVNDHDYLHLLLIRARINSCIATPNDLIDATTGVIPGSHNTIAEHYPAGLVYRVGDPVEDPTLFVETLSQIKPAGVHTMVEWKKTHPDAQTFTFSSALVPNEFSKGFGGGTNNGGHLTGARRVF